MSMTVQELIDELQKVEDKNKFVKFWDKARGCRVEISQVDANPHYMVSVYLDAKD